MILIVLLALLVLIFFGFGFALHVLWWVAIAALVVFLLGFLIRGAEGGRGYYGRRW